MTQRQIEVVRAIQEASQRRGVGGATVKELANLLNTTSSRVSHYIRVLLECGGVRKAWRGYVLTTEMKRQINTLRATNPASVRIASLTPDENQVLIFIANCIVARGVPPTNRQIATFMMVSAGRVGAITQGLRSKGFVEEAATAVRCAMVPTSKARRALNRARLAVEKETACST